MRLATRHTFYVASNSSMPCVRVGGMSLQEVAQAGGMETRPFESNLTNLPAVMTRREVAALARCSTDTILRAERAGDLRSTALRRGGRVRYLRDDVIAWLGAHREVAK